MIFVTYTASIFYPPLTVHKGGLGSIGSSGLLVDLDDTGCHHLMVEIVTLTGPLTDTGEHRETTVVLGDVVNQLHDDDSLTDTGTTEQTNLTSLGVRPDKINDLDTSGKDSICPTQ